MGAGSDGAPSYSEVIMASGAIPTDYHGHKFRSKLEAKWAFVLDRLGVVWEYEPEARQTEFGGYLPDFYLPMVKAGTWLEIKPLDAHGLEDRRWVEFVLQRKQSLVALFGLPDPFTDGTEKEPHPGSGLKIHAGGNIDYGYRLTMCAVCGVVGFEVEGRGARACLTRTACYGRADADRSHNSHDDRILAALVEARGAFTGHGYLPGRTLTDGEVAFCAQAVHNETSRGMSATRSLDRYTAVGRWSAADREAVMRAWGRLEEGGETETSQA